MANTPETSDFTSIKQRIRELQRGYPSAQPKDLVPFVGNPHKDMPTGLPFRLQDYLSLLDWTGRAVREDKRGAIPNDIPPILERLHIKPKDWFALSCEFESRFSRFAGSPEKVEWACQKLGLRWAKGMGACRQLLSG